MKMSPASLLRLLPLWTCWPELRSMERPKGQNGRNQTALLSPCCFSEKGRGKRSPPNSGATVIYGFARLIISNIVAAAGWVEANLALFTLVAVMIKCNLISFPIKQLNIHLGDSGEWGRAWHRASSKAKQPSLMLQLTKHGSFLAPAQPHPAPAHTPWPSAGRHSPRPLS